MYGTKPHAASCNRQRSNGVPPLAGAKADPRRIALLASVADTADHAPRNAMGHRRADQAFHFSRLRRGRAGAPALFRICRHSNTATLTVALNDAGPRRASRSARSSSALRYPRRMRDPKRRTSTSRRRRLKRSDP